MKVIDSFMFFNEFDILKLRLNYLNDVVDYFIISESNYTHSGKSKPYYLDDIIQELPNEIVNKIIRIKYEPDITQFSLNKKPDCCDLENDFWRLERTQRNNITNYLADFSPNDLLMVSDVDEIPRKETVKEYKEIFENYCGNALPDDFMFRCMMMSFYYNFNTYCGDRWCGTTISTVNNARQKSCDYFRNGTDFYPIEDGGYHFSTLGDVNHIRNKIQSFAHQEYNKEEYISDYNILKSIQNKEDIYHNSGKFQDYDISNFPEDLKELIIKIFPKEFYSV